MDQTGLRQRLPRTDERVPSHTKEATSKIIQADAERIFALKNASRAQIARRIHECEEEWDIERTLELNASIACGVGLLLAVLVNARWMWFSALVMLFLAQHAVQGWCPPMEVFRPLGFRTSAEIHDEIAALRALRGDWQEFWSAAPVSTPTQAGVQAQAVQLNREALAKSLVQNKRRYGSFMHTDEVPLQDRQG